MIQILATDLCTSPAGLKIFGFIGYILSFILIAVPIIIILMASIDLIKAIMAQKDDEIKKAQSVVIKRLIIGVVIFFVPFLVKFIINLAGGVENNPCLDCVLNNYKVCVENGERLLNEKVQLEKEKNVPLNCKLEIVDENACSADIVNCENNPECFKKDNIWYCCGLAEGE